MLMGTIDGNICYCFSFSIYDESVASDADKERIIRESIRESYPDAVFDDEENSKAYDLLKDLNTAKEFLHGQNLPFPCFRVLLPGYSLTMDGMNVADSCVYMSVFPESDIANVMICISVKNAVADDFVYLRHIQGNGRKLKNTDGRQISIQEIFHEVCASFQPPVKETDTAYLIEIKRFGQYEDVQSVMSCEKQLIYGIMCGDEGWRNVPESLADERLQYQWGSRDFIRLVTFGSNSVFFNLSTSEKAREYLQNRIKFDNAYYDGNVNPYFVIDSNVAGINHGILFSLEMVLVIKVICSRVIYRQSQFYRNNGNFLSREIQRIKAYRSELIVILNKVENLQISEIGELERIFMRSYEIEPVIEKIKYLLEILESELELIYQSSTNRLINLLTVAGVVLAAIQVLQGVL